jgi:hypothetical protein
VRSQLEPVDEELPHHQPNLFLAGRCSHRGFDPIEELPGSMPVMRQFGTS